MFLSVFEIFKIGIGPSSSHTMGPMSAASHFLNLLRAGDARIPGSGPPAHLMCRLHGSLAFTGKGHATDRAVTLGLAGLTPETLDPDEADARLKTLAAERIVAPEGLPNIAFNSETDIVFDYGPPLPGHANGMVLEARDAAGHQVLKETYYSIGGGFVLTEKELEATRRESDSLGAAQAEAGCPYPFGSAEEMLKMGCAASLSVAEMKLANECVVMPQARLKQGLDRIWSTMNACIDRGLNGEGELPGGLRIKRRAGAIRKQLDEERGLNAAQPHVANDWLSVYAMAVNEENAAGGRVVTAPTNGAAGVIPAVARYYLDHCVGAREDKLHDYLLTAAAIGGIIKHNASISGAECGCQAEVGSAAAMAAAGFCAVLGGSNAQIENAAEIALEHHLGMTCDPAQGLVQAPCIERNGLGAIKAVSAASLALRGDGSHFMPLDNCVEAMRQTGRDMNHKYKETSLGGLAVNLPAC